VVQSQNLEDYTRDAQLDTRSIHPSLRVNAYNIDPRNPVTRTPPFPLAVPHPSFPMAGVQTGQNGRLAGVGRNGMGVQSDVGMNGSEGSAPTQPRPQRPVIRIPRNVAELPFDAVYITDEERPEFERLLRARAAAANNANAQGQGQGTGNGQPDGPMPQRQSIIPYENEPTARSTHFSSQGQMTGLQGGPQTYRRPLQNPFDREPETLGPNFTPIQDTFDSTQDGLSAYARAMLEQQNQAPRTAQPNYHENPFDRPQASSHASDFNPPVTHFTPTTSGFPSPSLLAGTQGGPLADQNQGFGPYQNPTTMAPPPLPSQSTHAGTQRGRPAGRRRRGRPSQSQPAMTGRDSPSQSLLIGSGMQGGVSSYQPPGFNLPQHPSPMMGHGLPSQSPYGGYGGMPASPRPVSSLRREFRPEEQTYQPYPPDPTGFGTFGSLTTTSEHPTGNATPRVAPSQYGDKAASHVVGRQNASRAPSRVVAREDPSHTIPPQNGGSNPSQPASSQNGSNTASPANPPPPSGNGTNNFTINMGFIASPAAAPPLIHPPLPKVLPTHIYDPNPPKYRNAAGVHRITGHNNDLWDAQSNKTALPNCHEIGALEFLTYLPKHLSWNEVILRLMANGWDTKLMAEYALYARDRLTHEALKRVDESFRKYPGPAGNQLFGLDPKDEKTRFSSKRYPEVMVPHLYQQQGPGALTYGVQHIQRPTTVKEKHLKGSVMLSELSVGVVHDPVGQDKGVLTQVIEDDRRMGGVLMTSQVQQHADAPGFVMPLEARATLDWDARARERAIQIIDAFGPYP
jgi:hypothetical protein